MKQGKVSTHILLAFIIIVAVFFFLGVLRQLRMITNTHLIIGVVTAITIAILLIISKSIKSFFEERRESFKIISPVRAAELLKQFFLEKYGERVDIDIRRTFYPKVRSGRDKILRAYATSRDSGLKTAVKIPLDRGEEAILTGDLSFSEDFYLDYDKKEDILFSPEISSDPFFDQLKDLDPDVARGILAQEATTHIQESLLPQQQPTQKLEKSSPIAEGTEEIEKKEEEEK